MPSGSDSTGPNGVVPHGSTPSCEHRDHASIGIDAAEPRMMRRRLVTDDSTTLER